jgi:hypothetical protein
MGPAVAAGLGADLTRPEGGLLKPQPEPFTVVVT